MTVKNDALIPKQSDESANRANVLAIDKAAGGSRYAFIVAWGKFLGFTPDTVCREIERAEAEGAPLNAIQKIEGRWHTIDDIANDTNRSRVEALSRGTSTRRR